MGDFGKLAVSAAVQLAQANRQAGASNAAAAGQAQTQIQQIQQAQAARERQRRERLRQVLAQQRARFGAQNIRGGGSAEALLRGLANETERGIQDDRGLEALRIGGISGTLAERRRQNLLEASEARQRVAFGILERGLKGLSLLD